MSTSPSWFDQEKFSRLVRKVGPKPAPDPAVPSQAGSEASNRHPIVLQKLSAPAPATTEVELALQDSPTAPETEPPAENAPPTVVAPAVAASEPTAPSSPTGIQIKLPRRTASLPGLKALFNYAIPPSLRSTAPLGTNSGEPEAPGPAGESGVVEVTRVPPSPGRRDHATSHLSLQRSDDLADAWQKIAQLNEELAHVVEARDQAVKVGVLLREQLRQADEALANRAGVGTGTFHEELTRITLERDEAFAELAKLREQPPVTPEMKSESASAASAEELTLVMAERDNARRQYAGLREEYEKLKQDQETSKDAPPQGNLELEKQLADVRRQLEERTLELKAVKATSLGMDDVVEKHKQDLTMLREQLTKAREEASIAQRGLALSQKALHETRDTLREATEGTSLSRTNFENLKNECVSLSQQNQMLKAQNEQLLREVGAVKSKITTRL